MALESIKLFSSSTSSVSFFLLSLFVFSSFSYCCCVKTFLLSFSLFVLLFTYHKWTEPNWTVLSTRFKRIIELTEFNIDRDRSFVSIMRTVSLSLILSLSFSVHRVGIYTHKYISDNCNFEVQVVIGVAHSYHFTLTRLPLYTIFMHISVSFLDLCARLFVCVCVPARLFVFALNKI